ncbi:hypothetical protein I5U59_09510 [Stenotrophomonas maltophilia]|nr:hypothetical protein [Stenotrophomonas maltophilia]MBH1503312.1 hypothetical protein [Stenotrophomonas maltophilia]
MSDNKTLADAQPGGRVRLGDALLPCPLCGNGAEFVPYKDNGLTLKCKSMGCIQRHQRTLRYGIEWLRASMTEHWNTRALSAQPSPGGQGDGLVESLVQVMNAKYDGLGYLPADVLGVLNMAVEALAARQPVAADYVVALEVEVHSLRQRAARAHQICNLARVTYPEIGELADDGCLHEAIHDIMRVEHAARHPVGEKAECVKLEWRDGFGSWHLVHFDTEYIIHGDYRVTRAARQPVGQEPIGRVFYVDRILSIEWRDGMKPLEGAMLYAAPAQAVDLGDFKALYRAYVRLLESGRDRIRDLGGTCDPVDVMEANDVDLQAARRVLDSQAVGNG